MSFSQSIFNPYSAVKIIQERGGTRPATTIEIVDNKIKQFKSAVRNDINKNGNNDAVKEEIKL